MIYFDQAASSFPKPPQVVEAMVSVMTTTGANPGRGGHKIAREAADIIRRTREKAANIFGCTDPKKALFYNNATVALNQAIKGLSWEHGDHVISTSLEHNSVRRPLEYIKEEFGVEITYIPWSPDEEQFTKAIQQEIKGKTKLVALTHASNVTGAVLPIDKILDVVRNKGIITLVDASQTAGHIPIHMKEQGIDMLAFPGHKGLLGPQGTGMLLLEGDITLNPLHHGGTGSFSDTPHQPENLPEKLESGTLNTPGIAGLYAALECYEERKGENVPRETILIRRLEAGLEKIPGVICYGVENHKLKMPIVAFNIQEVNSQEIATILDSHYQIGVRAGLHCSPLGHETLNTHGQGVVRASLGIYNTEKEVDTFLNAIKEIAMAYADFD
ncbi:aminotransferase class V-fold PLP-dependent enzyme [Virgibacillus halodenitrificans]|uniref:aminotransferase class V-fold PLP-dependent enzyme n=1 Tax=Virgibacillus halodenitrificans TaxID=1482 RepID=UPI00045C6A36|nr:aminotransferase class V-fold PLP-dependent enzyme [Virgibacillus halodenitrificans]CDQ31960.1 putative cysteine desulfurase [Virgibacillus halodenitrificans]